MQFRAMLPHSAFYFHRYRENKVKRSPMGSLQLSLHSLTCQTDRLTHGHREVLLLSIHGLAVSCLE